jgi:hypothetical protein
MSQCLSADAIVSIGDALQWDVQQGLQHLQACEECRAQIDALRLTRSSFAEAEPVDEGVLRRITAAVGDAARDERERTRSRTAWTQAFEAAMAGVTALMIVVSARIPVDSVAIAVVAFGLGAGLLVGGKLLTRTLPVFARQSAGA